MSREVETEVSLAAWHLVKALRDFQQIALESPRLALNESAEVFEAMGILYGTLNALKQKVA